MKFEELGNWLSKQVKGETFRLKEKVNYNILAFMANITLETPVDTSKAISNWRLSTGSPISGEIDAYAKGKTGSTFSISRGLVVSFANAYLNVRKIGEPVYIINHVDYIADLNAGTSPQASAGFITKEIAYLVQSLTRL